MSGLIAFISIFIFGAGIMAYSIYKDLTEPDPEDSEIADLDINAPNGAFLCPEGNDVF